MRRSAARILKLRSSQGQASQLSDRRPRSGTGHDSRKSPVSQLGDSMCRKTGSSLRYGSEWLGKLAEAGAPSGGVLLPAVRCLAIFAPESATGSLRGEREARRVKITLTDTVHRPDHCGCADRAAARAPPISHQAAARVLQRAGDRNKLRCRPLLRRWEFAPLE